MSQPDFWKPIVKVRFTLTDAERMRGAVIGVVLACYLDEQGLFFSINHVPNSANSIDNFPTRTREIGIRMALGAAPAQVAGVVLTRTAKLVVVGIAIGFAMAFAARNFFSQILYGISAHDPFTYFSARRPRR